MIIVTNLIGKDRFGQDCDAGIDAVYWQDGGGPKRLIGFADRDKQAPLQLIVNGLAPVIIAEAKAKLRERDAADAPEEMQGLIENTPDDREVQEPVEVIEDEEDEDDDD